MGAWGYYDDENDAVTANLRFSQVSAIMRKEPEVLVRTVSDLYNDFTKYSVKTYVKEAYNI
jgi:hypothetical protein